MAVPVRKALFWLLLPLPLLALMHFFPESASWTVHQRFDLDGEANIPTWYATILLFLVSLTALTVYLRLDKTSPARRFWFIMSAAYGFLSVDEGACFHEALLPVVKWIYVYAPFAAAFLLYTALHLLKHEDRTVRNWILGGMIIYGTGALGLETVWYFLRPLPSLLQYAEVVAEEMLEMAGTIVVLAGCLRQLNRVWTANVESGVTQQPAYRA